MRQSKVAILFFIAILFGQKQSLMEEENIFRYAFASGLKISPNGVIDSITLIIMLMPIFLMIFYFGGSIQELINGYGKVFIVRKVSKTKLYLCKVGVLYIKVICCVVIQTMVYFYKPIGVMQNRKIEWIELLFYAETIVVILLLQMYLEFYLEVNYVNVFIILYVTVTFFVGEWWPHFIYEIPIGYLIFPNYLFGFRNGCFDQFNLGMLQSATILMTLNMLLIGLSIRKMKRIDIF